MIGLLPHPLPLSRQQVVFLSQSSCVSPVEFTDRREGWRRFRDWEELNHKTARKPVRL
jgi:hypothetical protein